MGCASETEMQRRLVDQLYLEAMVLADEARAYFEDGGRREREGLPPIARVTFSCESLRVTTRLMHVIAWLLTQRAVAAGEMGADQALDPSRRLGEAPASDLPALAELPPRAKSLVEASIELHRRVARFDAWHEAAFGRVGHDRTDSPVRALQERLAGAF